MPENTADSAEIAPACARTANTCLNEASPPSAALKMANRMPAMITADDRR